MQQGASNWTLTSTPSAPPVSSVPYLSSPDTGLSFSPRSSSVPCITQPVLLHQFLGLLLSWPKLPLLVGVSSLFLLPSSLPTIHGHFKITLKIKPVWCEKRGRILRSFKQTRTFRILIDSSTLQYTFINHDYCVSFWCSLDSTKHNLIFDVNPW